MKNRILLVLSALIACSATLAGQYAPQPLTIDFVNRTAGGDMVTVRFSEKEFENIGCGLRAFDDGLGGTTWFGFCQARDSEERVAFCNTANPELLSAMMATADFSYVTFSWDENGTCNRIGFSTQSFYIPEPLRP